MTGDNFASFLYLSLLGAVIAGYFLMQNRHRMGQMAQQALIWVLIFVGIVAAWGLWDDLRATVPGQNAVVNESGAIVVPRAADGHYHLTLEINDTPVRFIVDTGASDLVLTQDDARRVGIDPEALPFLGRARTANGTVATALVTLDSVALGPIEDRGVRARISGGEMPGSLLGMSYLQRFDNISIADGRMVLTR